MSGGSYDYLYQRTAFLSAVEHWAWQSMLDRLTGLGYAGDVADEMKELHVLAIAMRSRIMRLAAVFEAVEHWDSGDAGEFGVKTAVAQLRGVDLEACHYCDGTGLIGDVACPATNCFEGTFVGGPR